MAIVGAGIATLASKAFYLLFLTTKSKSSLRIKTPIKLFGKPLIAAIVMAMGLLIYNRFIEMNLITLLIEIILGILIYSGTMFLIKGFSKEDLVLAKGIFRKS